MSRRLILAVTCLIVPVGPTWADDPAAAATEKSVTQLLSDHDRRLVREIDEYIKAHPKAADLEQAFMLLFERVIEHDWFTEYEDRAKGYLKDNPEGAVRPLAQIVSTMARAQAGRYGEALTSYKELMTGLDRPDQEEFAGNFADNLAGSASAAGEFPIARQVYEILLARYGSNEALKEKVKGDLARLDRVGKPAPVSVVKDIDGKSFRSAELRGRWVLVDFWATWCAPCVSELPTIQSAYDKYHQKGLELVSVSLDETIEPVHDFVKARKLPWTQLHNATCGGDLVGDYGVNNIPASYLIDPEGKIVRLDLRGANLDKVLGAALGGAKPTAESR